MNSHRRVHRDTLQLIGLNRAEINAKRIQLEEMVHHTGCEICGRTIEDIAREARPDEGPNTVVTQVIPCEDFVDLIDRWFGLVYVHVVCSRCRMHPLLTPDDMLGAVRCPLAITEADRVLISLGEMS